MGPHVRRCRGVASRRCMAQRVALCAMLPLTARAACCGDLAWWSTQVGGERSPRTGRGGGLAVRLIVPRWCRGSEARPGLQGGGGPPGKKRGEVIAPCPAALGPPGSCLRSHGCPPQMQEPRAGRRRGTRRVCRRGVRAQSPCLGCHRGSHAFSCCGEVHRWRRLPTPPFVAGGHGLGPRVPVKRAAAGG